MRYRINAPRIALEQIDGETIAIDFDSGVYYSVGVVGSEIIRWILQGVSEDEAIQYARRRYTGSAMEIEQAIRSFVADLRREFILSETDETMEISPGLLEDQEIIAFETPVLYKYTDMKDLLLLDPIHEVDQGGWPIQKSDV